MDNAALAPPPIVGAALATNEAAHNVNYLMADVTLPRALGDMIHAAERAGFSTVQCTSGAIIIGGLRGFQLDAAPSATVGARALPLRRAQEAARRRPSKRSLWPSAESMHLSRDAWTARARDAARAFCERPPAVTLRSTDFYTLQDSGYARQALEDWMRARLAERAHASAERCVVCDDAERVRALCGGHHVCEPCLLIAAQTYAARGSHEVRLQCPLCRARLCDVRARVPTQPVYMTLAAPDREAHWLCGESRLQLQLLQVQDVWTVRASVDMPRARLPVYAAAQKALNTLLVLPSCTLSASWLVNPELLPRAHAWMRLLRLLYIFGQLAVLDRDTDAVEWHPALRAHATDADSMLLLTDDPLPCEALARELSAMVM